MRLDITTETERLARDPRLSDYDFWRTLKNIETELYAYESRREPIPFDLIRWRRIVRAARSRRQLRQSY